MSAISTIVILEAGASFQKYFFFCKYFYNSYLLVTWLNPFQGNGCQLLSESKLCYKKYINFFILQKQKEFLLRRNIKIKRQ